MAAKRQRLDATRKSVTHKGVIYCKPPDIVCPHCGKESQHGEFETDIYITVGLYPDERPGELFVKLGRYGDTIKGVVDQWATVVSIALQYGVPLDVICSKGMHTRFEPAGMTDTPVYDDKGCISGMYSAKSIIDYICAWLQREFVSKP